MGAQTLLVAISFGSQLKVKGQRSKVKVRGKGQNVTLMM